MKVQDLLSLINDNTNAYIINGEHKVMSSYDGKDSIGRGYLGREIVEIFAGSGTIEIMIKED